MNNKRVVVLSGTRFENLLNRDNFLTRDDTESMKISRKIFEKSFKKENIEEYLNNRMLKSLNS